MGANQSSDASEAGDDAYHRSRRGSPKRQKQDTKRIRIDQLLKDVAPTHDHNVQDNLSRIDIHAGLPPDPITKLTRQTTMRLGLGDVRGPIKLPIPVHNIRELAGSPEAMPLIKRKSLLYAPAPGLSTRNVRERAPVIDELPEVMDDSLLCQNGNNRIPNDYSPKRAPSPASSMLSSITGYKPGTLRIINGCPSPAISSISPLPNNEFQDAAAFRTQLCEVVHTPDAMDEAEPGTGSILHRPHPAGHPITNIAQKALHRLSSAEAHDEYMTFLEYERGMAGIQRSEIEVEDKPFVEPVSIPREAKVRSRKRRSKDDFPEPEVINFQPFSIALPSQDDVALSDVIPLGSKFEAAAMRPPTPPQPNNDEKLKHAPVLRLNRVLRAPSTTSSTTSYTSTRNTRNSSASSLDSALADVPEECDKPVFHHQTQDGRLRPPGKQPMIPKMERSNSEPKPFTCQQRRPKSLEEMIQATTNGHASVPQSPSSFKSHVSRSSSSSLQSRLRTHPSPVPLNYVPFEPIAPGATESKIKFYRAPAHWTEEKKAKNPDFGMRLQTARPIGDLKRIPRSAIRASIIPDPQEQETARPKHRPASALKTVPLDDLPSTRDLTQKRQIKFAEPEHREHRERSTMKITLKSPAPTQLAHKI